MSAAVALGCLRATSHPLQRAGAWAAAVMAGCERPDQVGVSDLDEVAARIVADACRAAVAAKDAPAYDWWKVLFALYPNAKVTHAGRTRDEDVLRAALAGMFAPDALDGGTWPCTFCGTDASALWAKSMLPMFDTNKALNTLPPGVAGWPVCRGCRVAMWALPYGSWVTAGSATVLSCEREGAERQFAERNVQRARRIMHAGFTGLAAGARPELVVLRALRGVGPELCATTLWSFKNDNQDPWLRVTRTRRAIPRFLAMVEGNAPLRRGWRLLELALTQRDKSGKVAAHGAAEAARLLFEAEDGRSRSVLRQVNYLLREAEGTWSPRDLSDLARLAFTYAEEILGMDVDLMPVATVIADWIEHGSGSPRGRLAEYRSVALSDYKLGLLLVQAHGRLWFDGRPPQAGPEDWKPLLQQRSRAWEQRMLLFASVSKLLVERGVAVNEKPVDAQERERTERLVELPVLALDDDDEMGAA
ncbi:hypothetical protein [Streptomyces sp. So13.3]|uniref:hypothetical protein n=1 Tax=Streptomyces sp. So13.3 TaxID=2136173 RepID=UPI00164DC2CC|nr:hypothetical protein [Streptomyces sp. So13.3]